jgi:hypothetical protein
MTDDDNEKRSGITATIEVSGKEKIEELESALEKERIEKEDLAAKIEMISEKAFGKAKETVVKKLGLSEEEAEEVTEKNIDVYKGRILEREKQSEEKRRSRNPALNPELGSGGSGKAPLSGEPSGKINHVKEYDSVADMMEDLRHRADSAIPEVRGEAKEIQKKLLEKMAKDKKSHNFEFEVDLNRIIEQKKKQKKGDINWDSA